MELREHPVGRNHHSVLITTIPSWLAPGYYNCHSTAFSFSYYWFMYVCVVTHISRLWINRVRLPILLVVSWTGKNNISLSAFAPENLVSRDGLGSPVPRPHLHTQAESGAYARDSSRVPRRRPFIYFKPPYAIGSVPSLLGHAIAYRWRSLPRVRQHRGSKPQGSSKRVLPRHVTMDQIIYASLSHTRYWYEVGMLKVPACMTVLKTLVLQNVKRSPVEEATLKTLIGIII